MSKNTNITQLDTNQIIKKVYDEDNDAQRVVIVSGDVPEMKLGIDQDQLTNAIQKGLEGLKQPSITLEKIEIPVIVKETVIERIEVPVIVKEQSIEKVEVPVIVKEIELKEIKVPVEIVKIVEIEKPIIIKEQQIQVLKEDTLETKYLRVVCGCLILLELITLVFFKLR